MGWPTQSCNSTQCINENEDFFEELYSDTGLKNLTIFFFFVGSILTVILECGIIWYERNGDNNYRTVLNQLFATLSWITIMYSLLAFVPEGIRYLIGPLNKKFCGIHIFVKNLLLNSFMLASDLIIGLRCLFIFKWTRISVFNDDLMALFLQLSIVTLSLWMTFVKLVSVGKMPLNYFMCVGRHPNDQEKDQSSSSITKKYDTTALLVIASFLLHIFAAAKIFKYQRQLEKRTKNIEIGRMNASALENDRIGAQGIAWTNHQEHRPAKSSIVPRSMADLLTQLLCLTLLVAVVSVDIAMNKTDPADLNKYQNRWLVYLDQIIAFSFGVSGICVQYYARNRAMRNAIWRNIRAPFQGN